MVRKKSHDNGSFIYSKESIGHDEEKFFQALTFNKRRSTLDVKTKTNLQQDTSDFGYKIGNRGGNGQRKRNNIGTPELDYKNQTL